MNPTKPNLKPKFDYSGNNLSEPIHWVTHTSTGQVITHHDTCQVIWNLQGQLMSRVEIPSEQE